MALCRPSFLDGVADCDQMLFRVQYALMQETRTEKMTVRDNEPIDAYGGRTAYQLGATGRFRLVDWQDAKWLVTPEGHPFFGLGVAHPSLPPAAMRAVDDANESFFGNDPNA